MPQTSDHERGSRPTTHGAANTPRLAPARCRPAVHQAEPLPECSIPRRRSTSSSAARAYGSTAEETVRRGRGEAA